MEFGHHIREYRDEIYAFLAEMIAIPSVSDVNCAEEGKPFGLQSARALNHILAKGKEMGFTTKNVGNYAGHVEYECGDDGMAAVLTHVDVVPAGSGWETDPFTLTEKDGLLFGRGVLDDKGSAVVSLFCLKALKEHGILGKRKLRCIFGAGEEIGMEDMPHYFAEEPLPDMAFTPDSDYGICNREKGILRFDLSAPNTSAVLTEFHGGQVVNAVPDLAKATILCTEEDAKRIRSVANTLGEDFSLEWQDGTAMLTVCGKAAHAMEPEKGHNASLYLLEILNRVFGKEALGPLPAFIIGKIGVENDGTSLGIAQADIPSGPLTLNLGTLHIDATGAKAGIDVRYPVTASDDAITETVRLQAEAANITYKTAENLKPLYAKEDSQLISILSGAYEAVTGEKVELYATGGGTYARCIPGRCVAFGPVFADEPDRKMHQCGEHIDADRFMKHAEICLEAMYRFVMTE